MTRHNPPLSNVDKINRDFQKYRADKLEARLRSAVEENGRLRGALKFYASQRGVGAVLASDGGMKARSALSRAAPVEEGEQE